VKIDLRNHFSPLFIILKISKLSSLR
jgi:hypothetical protein